MVITDTYFEDSYLAFDDGYDSFNKRKKNSRNKPRKKFSLKKLGNFAKNVGLFGIGAGAIAAGAAIGAVKRKKKKNKPVQGFGLQNQNPPPAPPPLETPLPIPADTSAQNPDADNLAEGASNDLSQINDSTTNPDPAKAAAAESHLPAYVPTQDNSNSSAVTANEAPADGSASESAETPATSDESSYDEDYSRWSGRGRRFVSQYYGYNDTKPESGTASKSQPANGSTDAGKESQKDKKAGISGDALVGFGALLIVAAISFYIVVSATKETKIGDTHKLN